MRYVTRGCLITCGNAIIRKHVKPCDCVKTLRYNDWPITSAHCNICDCTTSLGYKILNVTYVI